MEVDIKVGDTVCFGLTAEQRCNAPELEGTYAKVERVERHEGQIVAYQLSPFYKDKDCTIPCEFAPPKRGR